MAPSSAILLLALAKVDKFCMALLTKAVMKGTDSTVSFFRQSMMCLFTLSHCDPVRTCVMFINPLQAIMRVTGFMEPTANFVSVFKMPSATKRNSMSSSMVKAVSARAQYWRMRGSCVSDSTTIFCTIEKSNSFESLRASEERFNMHDMQYVSVSLSLVDSAKSNKLFKPPSEINCVSI
jgi:hypothetical protein